MGVWDSISELLEAATPWSVVDAEAPAAEPETQDAAVEEAKEEEVAEEAAAEEAEEEAEEEEEEEDDDDDDEPVDPWEQIDEDCKNSAACAPYKSTFDECVTRVTKSTEDGSEPSEDCVEEFFELTACATECGAATLWSKLK